MKAIVDKVRKDLKALGDPAFAQTAQRYFKENIKTYGVKTPAARAMAKALAKSLQSSSKADVFSLCETFWQSGYQEEGMIACELAYSQRKKFVPSDSKTFEHWISSYITNWATCDTLCNHTVGDFLMQYPGYISKLKKWAVSDNRWLKRAAAVSLIIPARKGLFWEEALTIARLQLKDTDDLVQKGYGWMLKSYSEHDPEPVFAFVIAHQSSMPRTALRYAVEKMPDAMRKEAMRRP